MRKEAAEKRKWLYDLTRGNLTDDAIVKGFLKHYVLHGLTITHAQRDIFPHKIGAEECHMRAMEALKEALTAHANAPEPPESRTLDEVRQIVAAVRAGIPMQIDHTDSGSEEDENPYIVKPCW